MADIKGKNILLVDDDEALVEVFQAILENEGYFVEAAYTGGQALKKLEASEFDLILLDIKLPDIMGDEVAKKVRERDDKTRIVMITGFPEFQEAIDALNLGISEILLKPISPDEIIRVTKYIISSL